MRMMVRSGVGHNSSSDGGSDGGDVPNNKNILCAVVSPLQRTILQADPAKDFRRILSSQSRGHQPEPPSFHDSRSFQSRGRTQSSSSAHSASQDQKVYVSWFA